MQNFQGDSDIFCEAGQETTPKGPRTLRASLSAAYSDEIVHL